MVSSLISVSCRYEGLVSLGGLLGENFNGLREVVVVQEVGLITCETGVVGHRARLIIRRSAQGILHRPDPHGR